MDDNERSDRPAEDAIEAFIYEGRWPRPGLLPVCVRLPRIAYVPVRDEDDEASG